MNLKVYNREKRDTDGNVVQEETSRVLSGITEFHMDLPHNTFEVVHRMSNGALVREQGELHRLFPKGEMSDYIFSSPITVPVESSVGHLIDPTTVSTAGITNPTGGAVRQDQVTRTESTGNQEDLQSGEVRPVEVPGATGTTVPSVKDISERLKQMRAKEEQPSSPIINP